MIMRLCGFLTAAVLVFGASVSDRAQAAVYAFTDASGVIHFTNKPSDPRYAGMARVRLSSGNATRSDALSFYPYDPGRYASLVAQAAREHRIDRALLQAVIAAESGYDPYALSPKGAVGLMQLMPDTARRYGVKDLYDPAQNIRGGARYLRDLMRKFNNDLSLALAAYNAGEDAIIRNGNRIPPYRETRLYVPRVLDLYRQYRLSSR
jgi:soluble lytic murein transglycosylase-like protein